MSHAKLQETLFGFTNKSNKPTDNPNVMSKTVAAFSDAWLIIDSVNRLQSLLNQMPNVKKKSPGFIAFSRKTKAVEDLRNHFQHLNNEIDQLVSSKSTAFGILNWITPLDKPPTRCYICALQSGTIRERIVPFINPVGKELYYPVSQITLLAGQHTLCISDLMRDLSKFTVSLEKGLGKQTKGLPQAGADLLLVLEVKFGETVEDSHLLPCKH